MSDHPIPVTQLKLFVKYGNVHGGDIVLAPLFSPSSPHAGGRETCSCSRPEPARTISHVITAATHAGGSRARSQAMPG